LKQKLMALSLSPLAILTIVSNFSFITTAHNGIQKLTPCEFISVNIVLLLVIFICGLWILYSVYGMIYFSLFRYTDNDDGYTIIDVNEKEDSSLNFFMSLIVPLLIDKVNTPQGASTLFIIVVLLCRLLAQTSLFYANPVLAILGYRLYEFKFSSNKKYGRSVCIALCRSKLSENQLIEFKHISDRVFYVRSKKK